jgi:hypothetical protein
MLFRLLVYIHDCTLLQTWAKTRICPIICTGIFCWCGHIRGAVDDVLWWITPSTHPPTGRITWNPIWFCSNWNVWRWVGGILCSGAISRYLQFTNVRHFQLQGPLIRGFAISALKISFRSRSTLKRPVSSYSPRLACRTRCGPDFRHSQGLNKTRSNAHRMRYFSSTRYVFFLQ